MTLTVKSIHDGKTATRVNLNSGSYVTFWNTGDFSCAHRECIEAGRATTNNPTRKPCEHIVFIRDNPALWVESAEERAAANAVPDPYGAEAFRFPGPGNGVGYATTRPGELPSLHPLAKAKQETAHEPTRDALLDDAPTFNEEDDG